MASNEAQSQPDLLPSPEITDPSVINVRNQIHQEIDHAKGFLSDTEKARLTRLWNRIDQASDHLDLSHLKDQVGSVIEQGLKLRDVPLEKIQRLKSLTGDARLSYLAELVECSENIGKYKKMLEANKKHFSPNSQKEYINDFSRTDKRTQDDWLKLFQESELKPRIELTERYEQFSESHRKKDCPQFFDLSRTEKSKSIKKMEEKLLKEYKDELLAGKNYRHMATTSKVHALKYLEATMKTKAGVKNCEQALKMLPKQMEAEAKLSKQYEKYPPELKKKFEKFYELRFEAKQTVLEEMKAEHEGKGKNSPEQKKMIDRYNGLLLAELAKNVISPITYKKYRDYLEKLVKEGKKTEIDNAFTKFKDEMAPRERKLKQFEALPDEIERENKDFYDLSGSKRKDRLEQIDEEMKTGKGKHNLLEHSKIKQDIDSAASTETIRKERLLYTITSEAAEIAHSSELLNSGTIDATKQTAHIQSKEEREQHEQIVEESKGKKVLKKDRVEEVTEFNVDRLDISRVREDRLLSLKRQFMVFQHNRDRKRGLDNKAVQFKNEGGQLLRSEQGKSKAEKQADHIRKKMADKIIKQNETRSGRPLTQSEKDAIMKQIAAKNLSVDLRDAT